MRVRILRSIATASRGFVPGSVINVDEELARAWIRAGIAVEDKSLDGPSEVKDYVSEIDNTTSNRTSDVGDGKVTSKGRRNR